jgi:hypothetical protein
MWLAVTYLFFAFLMGVWRITEKGVGGGVFKT